LIDCFIHSFIHSSIHSFIHPSIHSFMQARADDAAAGTRRSEVALAEQSMLGGQVRTAKRSQRCWTLAFCLHLCSCLGRAFGMRCTGWYLLFPAANCENAIADAGAGAIAPPLQAADVLSKYEAQERALTDLHAQHTALGAERDGLIARLKAADADAAQAVAKAAEGARSQAAEEVQRSGLQAQVIECMDLMCSYHISIHELND
jgi:hypothetical protein